MEEKGRFYLGLSVLLTGVFLLSGCAKPQKSYDLDAVSEVAGEVALALQGSGTLAVPLPESATVYSAGVPVVDSVDIVSPQPNSYVSVVQMTVTDETFSHRRNYRISFQCDEAYNLIKIQEVVDYDPPMV